MIDRRSLGAAALGAVALSAVASGTSVAEATSAHPWVPMPDPAATPVPNPPFPKNLTRGEREHLKTFDELDFDVFTHAKWDRLAESHARNIRVHWPDGHYTDGIDKHIADLAALFVWAPDTRILSHPLRVAKNELTAVTGVMQGTFTRPMPDGKGGFIKPTGKKYAINMATVGIWNRRGTMDEEFLFWDNQTFYQQIGLA
ncbi:ester cyclase [Kibdelosporangium philippinense]|uniref:Ester cyclase n=1 Tax=Kibdelosporangium philippinense TaxID=211113 RepID=A0ABS8ZBZ8_9PSEU|nr:ester cyclase [Kibdelosporangium philippinense]MCE7004360.1 ester cyclase [Kibdelosporangium philippinense]